MKQQLYRAENGTVTRLKSNEGALLINDYKKGTITKSNNFFLLVEKAESGLHITILNFCCPAKLRPYTLYVETMGSMSPEDGMTFVLSTPFGTSLPILYKILGKILYSIPKATLVNAIVEVEHLCYQYFNALKAFDNTSNKHLLRNYLTLLK